MATDSTQFNLEEIIALGKRENLTFAENYWEGSYMLAIFANGKQAGVIEVDKQTRKTISKNITLKYLKLANYIEYVFKTTKQPEYPIEFRESLAKI